MVSTWNRRRRSRAQRTLRSLIEPARQSSASPAGLRWSPRLRESRRRRPRPPFRSNSCLSSTLGRRPSCPPRRDTRRPSHQGAAMPPRSSGAGHMVEATPFEGAKPEKRERCPRPPPGRPRARQQARDIPDTNRSVRQRKTRRRRLLRRRRHAGRTPAARSSGGPLQRPFVRWTPRLRRCWPRAPRGQEDGLATRRGLGTNPARFLRRRVENQRNKVHRGREGQCCPRRERLHSPTGSLLGLGLSRNFPVERAQNRVG